MTEDTTLASLGWSQFFQAQLEADELSLTALRVASVHKTHVHGLTVAGPLTLALTGGVSAGELAVGDWVLAEGDRFVRRLDRKTLVSRRASGSAHVTQLIAANVDTLFIVTSCNADFNPARLERYLALASDAETLPVILLTKSDASAEPASFVARAEALQRNLMVLALDARDPAVSTTLAPWCGRGQTVALVGSSGVGKTTLTNSLTGLAGETAAIRENDARGRHTTTARSLHALIGGGWLIDTPGMRSLSLVDASDGIDAVFSDVTDLVGLCRFRDCTHETEPGCAVRQAIAEGTLDEARLIRWTKLKREDLFNSETPSEARARSRQFGRVVKKSLAVKSRYDGKR